MQTQVAEIVREYGPFDTIERVNGLSFDGSNIWIAVGDQLCGIDPEEGEIVKNIAAPAPAGTAFDGKHLYQIADGKINKIDMSTGSVLTTIPAPSTEDNSGLTWAEGYLWVGQYAGRKILQLEPQTGTVLRTIESDRFVTGVTWVDGELWHGVWDDEGSELRRLDPQSGDIQEHLTMPSESGVSGLESDGNGYFYCGGGGSKMVRKVRRPKS